MAGCSLKTNTLTLVFELNGSSSDGRKTKCARQAGPVSVGPKFLDYPVLTHSPTIRSSGWKIAERTSITRRAGYLRKWCALSSWLIDHPLSVLRGVFLGKIRTLARVTVEDLWWGWTQQAAAMSRFNFSLFGNLLWRGWTQMDLKGWWAGKDKFHFLKPYSLF